jgi:FkbM family methyltransferase
LRKNVEQNGFADRITVFETALAATTGFADLDDNGGGSGLNGLVSAGHGSTATSTRVQTVAFDEAIAKVGQPVEVVKMDCEGGEYDLVYGSSPQSWDSVQRIVLEYHEVPGQSWDELRGWFADRGFTVEADAPAHEKLGSAWLSREPLSSQARASR